jgi:hypothetical protein
MFVRLWKSGFFFFFFCDFLLVLFRYSSSYCFFILAEWELTLSGKEISSVVLLPDVYLPVHITTSARRLGWLSKRLPPRSKSMARRRRIPAFQRKQKRQQFLLCSQREKTRINRRRRSGTHSQKLRNAQLLLLVRPTNIRHSSDTQRRRPRGHQHHRKPQNRLLIQQPRLRGKPINHRDRNRRPQNEAHKSHQRPGTPGHGTRSFALFPFQ